MRLKCHPTHFFLVITTLLTGCWMALAAPVAPPPAPPPPPPLQVPPAPTEAFGVPLPPLASKELSLELAKRLLPDSFKQLRSPSHVVLTDSDWDSLAQTRHTLRKSWTEYRSFCRRLGVVVPRPDEKLICIVFKEHEDFLEFGRKTERTCSMLDHAGGYFSPRFDWIVFFEPLNHAYHELALSQIDQMLFAIDQEKATTQLDTLDPETAEKIKAGWQQRQQMLESARDNIADYAKNRRTTITVHEAIHQFTHVCHTWPGKHYWPSWLDEGFATAFETSNVDRGFGPDRLSEDRDLVFMRLLVTDQLMPLRDFLALEGYGDQTPGTLRVLYPQAYGLVTWLFEFRKAQFAQFLKRLSAPPSENGIHDPVVLFQEIFGDLDRLESRWHRFELTNWREARH